MLETILRDAAFTKQFCGWIVIDRLTAPAALHELLHQYTSLFSHTKDEYLKEHLNDVRDVIVRISEQLTDVLTPGVKGFRIQSSSLSMNYCLLRS